MEGILLAGVYWLTDWVTERDKTKSVCSPGLARETERSDWGAGRLSVAEPDPGGRPRPPPGTGRPPGRSCSCSRGPAGPGPGTASGPGWWWRWVSPCCRGRGCGTPGGPPASPWRRTGCSSPGPSCPPPPSGCWAPGRSWSAAAGQPPASRLKQGGG